MPVARLLAAALLLCSPLAFSQNQQGHTSPDSALQSDSDLLFELLPGAETSADASAQPWRIIPEQPQQKDSAAPFPNIPLNDQAKLDAMAERAARLLASIPYDPNSQNLWIKFSPEGELQGWGLEDTCYSIRSYVVARDNKDSDATHLVRSSTCVPARQYGVKTTVLKQNSQSR